MFAPVPDEPVFTVERRDIVNAPVPRFFEEEVLLLLRVLFWTFDAILAGGGGGATGGGGAGGSGILGAFMHIVKPWLGYFRFEVYSGRLENGLQNAVRNRTSAHFEPSHNQNRPVRGKLLLTY